MNEKNYWYNYTKNNSSWLKTNTLKKVLFSDDKNT